MDFNFAEHTTVDTLEKVPQDFRGLYVPADGGKFKLDSDDPKVKSAVSAITGLARSLVASRAEAKAARGKAVDLSALAEYGETPETILENVNTKIAEASKAGKGKAGEDKEAAVKAATDALAAKHAQDLKARDDANLALKGQLHHVLLTGEATQALAGANVVDVDLALPHVAAQVQAVEEGGKVQVQVVNQDRTLRYSGSTGLPMTIKELVAEMKGADKYKVLFKSEGTTGGGNPPTQRGGTPPMPKGERDSVGKIADGLAKLGAR